MGTRDETPRQSMASERAAADGDLERWLVDPTHSSLRFSLRHLVIRRSRYEVKGSLDRQAFGLHWNQDLDIGGVVVGDEIAISADVELHKHQGP